jgi:Na+-transporting methylmalonyl-CoA/oxaloacetate decarboxylase gamma subunit
MKRLFLTLLVFIPIFCFAKIEQPDFNRLDLNNITLQELSAEIQIPIKKLKECLELPQTTDNHATLSDLTIGKQNIILAIDRYNEDRFGYYQSIVILGMLIVFGSLMITAVFIGLLQHTVIEKKPKTPQSRKHGKQEASREHVSSNAIVAAIATVYMHEWEIEEQNKMILTWKRAPLSLWKVSRILPNQEFYKGKRKS